MHGWMDGLMDIALYMCFKNLYVHVHMYIYIYIYTYIYIYVYVCG